MTKTFINIGHLIQVREAGVNILRGAMMADVPELENAWLRVEDGLISDFGSMDNFQAGEEQEVIDLKGRMVAPTFVDSHTHLVFAEDRDEEFVMKIKGMDYQSIADAGGGILNSARKLQQMSLEELTERAALRLQEVIQSGTGAIEIKSGYGLTMEAEIKML
ncbi:MAG: amidohydrolase family protein, partial [Cytophagia bacterium]|nr:amidohydrolase family protein [Cytophagia bacterium]